jgi:hypothetical protein
MTEKLLEMDIPREDCGTMKSIKYDILVLYLDEWV